MRDLTGKIFGRLTVVSLSEVRKYKSARNQQTKPYWLCSCSCGNEKIVRAEHLTSGRISSCGCLAREVSAKIHITHGMTKSPEYRSWSNMRSRVHNPDSHHQKYYSDVTICERWNSFENFLTDMGRKPSTAHEIDRIDAFGHYEPMNCRWATRTEQVRNQRRNSGFYDEYLSFNPAVNYSTYKQRIRLSHWDKETAAKTPRKLNQFG